MVEERRLTRRVVESLVEQRIREALQRGEFDDLPGAGKPLEGLDGPHDDLWWVKRKMQRECLSLLPPALALRRDVEDAMAQVPVARDEAEVRRIVDGVNARIRAALATPPSEGPPVDLAPYDVEQVLAHWRSAVEAGAGRAAVVDDVGVGRSRRTRHRAAPS
ncbi:uncharacterized protein DUF1992 [Motilibacter rhizosphaerae]|uniref:Uncharacterized protein DUF1992 n=1 Tax=Motilibacter rhizosphaerae TaxID=598652 RepID=A0A4Q7NV56_9ACTN|nr:DUF1992 domain-containing protein [Motilibacter rhizosphaerae]RZS91035.1 uncharacterized protein DUF1992 [Motilibacter rhizosphaerae]